MKSNITVTSNIYPIKSKNLQYDREFLNKVEGRPALAYLKKNLLHTLNDIQEDQYNYETKCSHNEEGDLTWGLVKNGEKLTMKCRCLNLICKLFNKCRKDYTEDEKCVNNDSVDNKVENTFEDLRSIKIKNIDSVIEEKETLNIIKNNEEDISKIWNGVKEKTSIYNTIDEKKEVGQAVTQEYVIQENYKSKIFVNAGPGTGKTYTLIERLKYLADNEEINPAEDMLVLCFSRAAVAEVNKRLKEAIDKKEAGSDLAQLDIRTFDSFATWLIKEMDDEVDLTGKDYDERIRIAIQVIKDNPDLFDSFKHFVVDEVQDLVGVRAELVQTILSHIQCGFTLLGDLCQSVYDYQVEDTDQLDSVKFNNWVKESFKDDIKQVEFTKNHRQSEALSELCSGVRNVIKSDNEGQLYKNTIKDVIGSFTEKYDISSMENIVKDDHKKKCILCRTNGEVLRISQTLRNQDIKHSIQRAANDRYLERWLGEIFTDYKYDTIDFEEFEELIKKKTNYSRQTINAKWHALNLLVEDRSSRISIKEIVSTLSNDRVLATSLYENKDSNLIVSTIHRSKGREYDEIILLDNSGNTSQDNNISDDKDMQELKTFYVGITRSKNEISKIKFTRKAYLRKIGRINARWVQQGSSKNKKTTVSLVEVGLECDVDKQSFISMNHFDNKQEIINNQKYIVSEIVSGDEVSLRLVDDCNGYMKGRYDIYHEDHKIGSMSDDFTKSIAWTIKNTSGFIYYLPVEIQKVFVDEVVTFVTESLDIYTCDNYKKNKIWNGITVIGFGQLKWKKTDL